MASTPPKLWVGVPAGINAAQRVQLNDFVTSAQLGDVNSALMQTLIGLIGAQRLQADTTFYVANGGSDSADGFTAGTAWQTLQHAWDTIVGHYNLNGYRVTINVAAGTYAPLYAAGSPAGNTHGASGVSILGAGPTVTGIIGTAASSALSATQGAEITVRDLRVNAPVGSGVAGSGLYATTNGVIAFSNVDFIQCLVAHCYALSGGRIYIDGAYSISGGSNIHLAAGASSVIAITSNSLATINGTLPFGTFAYATTGSIINVGGWTFTGATTGVRYGVALNSVIMTSTGNPNFFPGDQAGTTATGGQYG